MDPLLPREDETLDSIGTADVRVLQRREGYRFGLDSVLLAAFAAEVDAGGPLLELGAGAGVVSLLLARQFGLGPVTALERQEGLHERLVRNVSLNACEGRVRPLRVDWREARGTLPGAPFAHVVTNPPFWAPGAGRLSPDGERQAARHELHGAFPSLVLAARRLLRPGGALTVVHLASRLAVLVPALAAGGFSLRRLRLVHPRAEGPAHLALLHARLGAGEGLVVPPPLVVHGDGPGGYSPEVARWLSFPGTGPSP